jgi:brefeldin A-inhibited guanine nucleotide-exchange protein
MLRGVIPVMLNTPECGLTASGPQNIGVEDPMIKYWFPVLFGFYDIIMNGEDLEVRRLALDSLFNTLKKHGSSFPVEFWDTVCQELLFPIFAVLKSSQDLSRFSTQEDMSVWLSTTMIQALRDLIDLYTFYFDILERFLDGLLDLLCVCICQGMSSGRLRNV